MVVVDVLEVEVDVRVVVEVDVEVVVSLTPNVVELWGGTSMLVVSSGIVDVVNRVVVVLPCTDAPQQQ